MKKILFALFFLAAFTASAQFQYKLDQSIPLEVNGKSISMPWAGGLNSAQMNTMDLNGDNLNDIVIYDKGVGKIWTFVRSKTSYQYAPEFETLFTMPIQSFVLLRDYNCDGKKDLFTYNNSVNGISVYMNTRPPGQKLSWHQVKIYTAANNGFTEILLTKGFSGMVNVLPGIDDLPHIADMDGDGDLDILNMRFVNPGTAEYHKNLSKETYGVCDSLIFERQTQRWGDWEECSCAVIAFGTSCTTTGGRVEHTGGKALFTFDMDHDGDQDLLYSEEKCSQLFLLPNQGTATDALMKSLIPFPTSHPIVFPLFPSPFLEDVDFDGLPDMLISTNINTRTLFNTNFSESVWLYKNTGTSAVPNFTFSKTNFLQENMIDVGDNSVPAFIDYDNDGDLDLFIGTFTSADDFSGRIIQYENTGTASAPSFRWVSDDFASLSFLNLYNVKPQFVDIDGNGTVDLTFTGSQLNDGTTSLYYIPNKSREKLDVSVNDATKLSVTIASTENIFLCDINRDGVVDMLVGKSTGALQYQENTAAAGSFNFVLKNSGFLNLGVTTARQNLSIAIADLDADGNEDLITGDQGGRLTVFNNFRSTDPVSQGITDMVYDSLNNTYDSKNLGGRVWPTVANLYSANRPVIAVGNTTGGIYLLKSEDTNVLSDEPSISVWPNPLPQGESLTIKTDRNATLQIFSILGQKIGEPLFIPANQLYSLPVQNISSGLYIARFTTNNKSIAKRFVIQ